MKYYHMIIEPRAAFPGSDDAKRSRREYISRTQGSAPDGWRCVGVCGYHCKVEPNADGMPDRRQTAR